LESLTGKWRLTSGCEYFEGLTIHKSGAYECKSGSVTDGLVRVLSEEDGRINLKRKIDDANDHIFTVKHGRMSGGCSQSKSKWVLEKEVFNEPDTDFKDPDSLHPHDFVGLTATLGSSRLAAAQFGFVWDPHRNYRVLTVETQEAGEIGSSEAGGDRVADASVHPHSLNGHDGFTKGYHTSLECAQFRCRLKRDRKLVTIEDTKADMDLRNFCVRDAVRPSHIRWTNGVKDSLGAHINVLRFNWRSIPCDEGKFRAVTIEEDIQLLQRQKPTGIPIPPLPAALQCDLEKAVPLRVMSFNVWHNYGRSLSKTLDCITAGKADIVCLQESAPEMTRFCAQSLGYFFSDQNAILSRFPIHDPIGFSTKHKRIDGWGGECKKGGGVSVIDVLVEGAGLRRVLVANVHLCHWPYEAFQKRQRKGASEAVEVERTNCLPALKKVLQELRAAADAAGPGVLGSLLCGDFNATSHLDYKDHDGEDVQWPCTSACEAAGLEDTYAIANPGHLASWRKTGGPKAPGVTWTSLPKAMNSHGCYDRIDFIHASREGLLVDRSVTLDEETAGCDPWPSDHRAVLTDMRFRVS
jgi:exonuclease III